MIWIPIFVLTIAIANSLVPKQEESPDEEIKKIVAKYVNRIPDLPPRYVINEGLNKLISQYYDKKINTFPLYKISLKIDRTPVKIPWSLGAPDNFNETKPHKKYTYMKAKRKNPKMLRKNKKLNKTAASGISLDYYYSK